MIDKSDKHKTSRKNRKAIHLHDERWIIISLEIDIKKIICRNSLIYKKERVGETKRVTDITSIDNEDLYIVIKLPNTLGICLYDDMDNILSIGIGT